MKIILTALILAMFPLSANAENSHDVEVFATFSPFAGYDTLGGDGYGPSQLGTEYGLGMNLNWRALHHLGLGIGMRVDATISGLFFASVPLQLRVLFPFKGGDDEV